MRKKSKGTAIVTGGAIRIGRAISLALAEAGYDIAIVYNSSADEVVETAKQIEIIGQKCCFFQYDLNNISGIKNLITQITEKFGSTPTTLINNASIFEQCQFLDTTEDIFDRHTNINFKAPFFLTQEFARICKSGQVINILDTYISKTSSNYFIYLLTKKSLHDFTRMAARELGPDIRVNAIAIGTTELSVNLSDDYLADKANKLPMSRLVTLDDITNALTHLLEMEFVTGQCIFVDGGESLL